MKNKFSSPILDINKYECPLLETAFVGKDGRGYVGAMLIDTGSAHCVLNSFVLDYIEPMSDDDRKLNIQTMGDSRDDYKHTDLTFIMGGQTFVQEFWVNKNVNVQLKGNVPIIGIIGVNFLTKHSLVVDFDSMSVHTARKNLTIKASSCNFISPIGGGINMFGIPVVCMAKDDKNDFALGVDTGANNTIVTKHLMDDCNIEINDFEKTHCVQTLHSVSKLSRASIPMNLKSLDGATGNTKICQYTDNVLITDEYDYIAPAPQNREGAFPLSGLLSTSFMTKNKWIIDFSHYVIYSKCS